MRVHSCSHISNKIRVAIEEKSCGNVTVNKRFEGYCSVSASKHLKKITEHNTTNHSESRRRHYHLIRSDPFLFKNCFQI